MEEGHIHNTIAIKTKDNMAKYDRQNTTQRNDDGTTRPPLILGSERRCYEQIISL